VLRAAAAAADSGTRIGRATLDRLASGAAAPGAPWPDEARAALVGLLGSGRAAIPVLEALDQKSLLVAIVPEWEAVRHRPQRNAYHRFTVDRHLCEAAAEAAALTERVARPDLLLLGAWLHDLGKGYAGQPGYPADHSEAGVQVVERLVTRMGFEGADVATLGRMVLHHLLLADAATRRDIDDEATLASVAEVIGDTSTLELLHALTEADGMATGPAAWSHWKKGLVDALVSRVAAVLSGQEPTSSEFPGPAHLALAARVGEAGGAVIEAREHWLTVAAPDRPGLFCRVAGTLAVHGLDVLAARAWSGEDGVAVEDFRVEPVSDAEPDWEAVEADLRRALTGRLSLEGRLAERVLAYAGRARLVAAVPTRTEVTVANDASSTSTVVEVRAPDRIGTLYRITRVLADLGLDIRSAKVATVGHEVVDAFYVVDSEGAKITDEDRVATIEGALRVVLSGVEASR
jgi:[protein-PII] uridylyltransferase